jgi:hypothetical protein
MANNAALRANFDNFLYDMQGQLQRLFARDNVLLAEASGVVQASPADPVIDYDANYGRYTRAMDGNREHFEGEQVRVPVLTAALQGAGAITESSTWNVPIPIENQKATAKLAQVLVPFALSLALERDSKSGSLSAMSAVQLYTEEAYGALAFIEDQMLNRNGDALLATITATNTGLTQTVATTSDFDVLVPGAVVDVLTISTGADPGQGKRRRIASVNTGTGVITFDTTQQASDGGSGSIVATANTTGIFLAGSWGNAMQGFGQAVTVGGTPFEGIDVANVPRWSAFQLNASAAGLSDSLLMQAAYKARGNGAGWHDFGIGHPGVVDKYIASKTPTVYYQPQEATLRSGFSGIVYQGADRPYPLVKSINSPRQKLRLLRKDSYRLYGDSVGPAFIDDDGGIFRFFNRQTVKEADLLDRVQLLISRPNSLVEITNLAEQYTP